jgi:FlaA1/EpsC-like NDP-sugar epimerase
MGKPIKILDLAIKMIRLSGLELKDKNNPSGDIEVEFSGLRPGEKLYEELIIGNNTSKTENPMIMRAMEDMIPWEDLDATIMDLKVAINSSNHSRIQELLIKIVPEFTPEKEIFDHLFSANKSD